MSYKRQAIMDASAEPATKANLLSWVKIAVAVAVIRCKPPGDSALKHAERICSKFWTNQLSLQTNFQQTKAELSHLQKQLTEEKNVPRGTAEKCHNLSPMQVLSGRHHDLTPPPSVEYVAGQLPHFGTDNSPSIQTMTSENTKYIQSVFNLQRLLYPTDDQPNQATVVREAVSSMMTQAQVMACEMLSVPDSTLRQSAVAVCHVMSAYPWLDRHEPFMKEVCAVVEGVLKKLTEPSDYGQYPAHRRKHAFSAMLVEYLKSSPPSLCAVVVESLVEALESACRHLATSLQSSQPPDVDCYESAFFLIQCLEQAAIDWRSQCLLHPSLLHQTQRKLDTSVGRLGGQYRLVGQSVWQVSSLIESVLQNMV